MYAIKRELQLNNKQRTLLRQHSGYSRWVYNYALDLLKASRNFEGTFNKKLNEIKKVFTNHTKKLPEYQWMNKLSSRVYQHAFMNAGKAYKNFFEGRSEFPKYKSRKHGDSFTVDNCSGVMLLEKGKRIKIPTLGTFRLKEKLDVRYATQTFTISRQADKWFVSFAVNAERIPPLFHEVTEPIGIDLGVKCFATLSDGSTYENPKPYRNARTKLSRLNWLNRRKQLGNRRQGVRASNNAKKFYTRVAKLHARVSNIRKDFLHKTTTEITKKYSHVKIEDLNVAGMMANHKLAAAVSDQGFYEFRRQLGYKQVIYSCRVEVLNRWYPSSKMCNKCQHIQDMKLSDRVFICKECGHTEDRDLNASKNIAEAPEEMLEPLA